MAIKSRTNIRSLKLRIHLSNKHYKILGSILESTTSLTYLDIEGNKIKYKGSTYLSDGLKLNNTLKKLNLSKNIINKKSLTKIVERIHKNKSIKTLICRYIFTKDRMDIILSKLIKNETIIKLDIRFNPLDSTDINYLFTLISRNKTLIDLRVDIDEDEHEEDESLLLVALSENRSLRTLSIKRVLDIESLINLINENKLTRLYIKKPYHKQPYTNEDINELCRGILNNKRIIKLKLPTNKKSKLLNRLLKRNRQLNRSLLILLLIRQCKEKLLCKDIINKIYDIVYNLY
jgi:hypothetical protein